MSISIVLYAAFLFFVSEMSLLVFKRSHQTETKVKQDRKSLLIFWLTIPLSITLGFMMAKYEPWNTMNRIFLVVGLVVYGVGFVLRWMSIYQLKSAFTVDVAITKGHALQTDGLYKKLRHPSYLGLILILVGLAMGMNSLRSLLVLVVPVCIAIVYRVNVEERMLVQAFGAEYEAYKSKTYRFIPWIY